MLNAWATVRVIASAYWREGRREGERRREREKGEREERERERKVVIHIRNYIESTKKHKKNKNRSVHTP